MVIEANNFSLLPLLANLRLGAEKTVLLMGELKEDENVTQTLSPAQGPFIGWPCASSISKLQTAALKSLLNCRIQGLQIQPDPARLGVLKGKGLEQTVCSTNRGRFRMGSGVMISLAREVHNLGFKRDQREDSQVHRCLRCCLGCQDLWVLKSNPKPDLMVHACDPGRERLPGHPWLKDGKSEASLGYMSLCLFLKNGIRLKCGEYTG